MRKPNLLVPGACLTVALTLLSSDASSLETKIEGFDARERPQFLFLSKPAVKTVPGLFVITNSMRTFLRESSIRGLRVHSFDAEWISAGLKGPLCPASDQKAPGRQPQQPKRPCNPIEGRVGAMISFFAVDPNDFGLGYGFKVQPVLFKSQSVGSLPELAGRAPAYMPVHRVIGVIPSGLMPKYFTNPAQPPTQRLEVIAQLSIGGFKTAAISGDIWKDNAVFQTRSIVTRSTTGLYTYTYEIQADFKRGVAFNWTSVRAPQFPHGWKARLPTAPIMLHEVKDAKEEPLLVNDPAFVSFGSEPKWVEEISALAIAKFPIPPPVKPDTPLSAMAFRKGRDDATGQTQLGQTTVSAIFDYLRSVDRKLVEYMFLAPAFIPDTYGITPR